MRLSPAVEEELLALVVPLMALVCIVKTHAIDSAVRCRLRKPPSVAPYAQTLTRGSADGSEFASRAAISDAHGLHRFTFSTVGYGKDLQVSSDGVYA